MSERSYERINDYSAITIQLASPNDIRSWSYGEVKNPETINYRTYKAEKDGLFCERIFGPEKDWECSCGKYKGIKYKDIICDRCGVKVTHSKVRRSRMGHINLAAPVVHIWFFKAMPSRLGNLLGIKTAGLQQVVYFQKYLVIKGCADTNNHKCKNPVKKGDLLTEDEYRRRMEECTAGMEKQPENEADMPFVAKMGAEAIKDILAGNRELNIDPLDLDLLAKSLRLQLKYSQLRREMKATENKKTKTELAKLIAEKEAEAEKLGIHLRKTESRQGDETNIKRLRIVEKLLASENRPEWMVLDVIPVIPPDLRPLVPLESGNFATSDLNDLYRRVINRNNRMKKLLELNAPGVIIRNEKRMLQQAVDALFDNSRCKRSVMGSGNRPLKSLTDMIKGKQGRFRENLLGKRVDYSARSVIVVGPDLKLNECGLPKKIALELFQPFIIRKLKERGYADTIKSAKKMLERRAPEVWDVLEEVIKGHPVMLNRAPTLHRMGIQAFMPVLIEGDAITIHPLVCHSFNADFDGDQMAVHLPLSLESQVEAELLLLSTENIFSPAHGKPIITADQDIVLGCYYLTCILRNEEATPAPDYTKCKFFKDAREVFLAFDENKINIHDEIYLYLGKDVTVVPDASEALLDEKNREMGEKYKQKGIFRTTVGRVIFNDILPAGMPFYNVVLNKKTLNKVVSDCCDMLGRKETILLLDRIKYTGFHSATISGMSFSARDLIVPKEKNEIIDDSEKKVKKIEKDYRAGVLSQGERYNQIIDIWTHATNQIEDLLMLALKRDRLDDNKPYLNPIYVMATSAARGNSSQIRQLAGMRGLMAKPSGKIIETPIKANFREGLRGLEYFSSTHGARKGLADTALKTADSGYLTRKLVEVAQDAIISCEDCGTLRGVAKGAVYRGDKVAVTLSENIRGRVARDNIVNLITDEVIVRENELIDDEKAKKIEDMEFLGVDPQIMVRSPLTCEAEFGLCAKCYGMDLSTGRMVEEGVAVGVIAAQSVGEPGTQLTMRTFHIGGTATRALEKAEIRALRAGSITYKNLQSVVNRTGQTVVLSRKGEMALLDDKGREVEKHSVPLGAVLKKAADEKIKKGEILATWDAHSIPVLSARGGRVKFEDIIQGVTVKEETDPRTGVKRMVIVDFKSDKHPVIIIEDEKGERLCHYDILEKAHIEVQEGEMVEPGHLLAKTPREISGTQDITGGLPRVTELFEARRPKDPAIISEIDGVVSIGEKKRGKRTIIVENEITGMRKEHLVPPGKPILVHADERVMAGDQLVAGSPVPHDVIRIRGESQLQQYLLREVQAVYRSQKVQIDDKHIEILVRQMLRKVKVIEPGDTLLLPGDVISKSTLMRTNREVVEQGGKPANAEPMLLGIARASLQSESFVAAASFQETTKVLTEAAIAGRRDDLRGLKENVILGHIIPAGTGFPKYWHGEIVRASDPEIENEEESEIEEELLEEVSK